MVTSVSFCVTLLSPLCNNFRVVVTLVSRAQAQRNQPAIIFFDEIDSVLRARQSGEEEWVRKVKNEFLVRLQEIQVRGASRTV